jgi:hypothetical protein
MASAEIPKFAPIKYNIDSPHIDDVEQAVMDTLAQTGVMNRVKRGASIAITVGSREIDRIDLIIRIIVREVKKTGGIPFIVPAMGSHGGADADNQVKLLRNFGITEENVGAPIRSTIETVHVGMTEDNLEVHIDRYAAEADGIIVIGRVKPHTSFKGKVESGLMKMLAIGLGKPYGAALCHQLGFPNMGMNVWNFGQVILDKMPVLFGLAIVDNNRHKIFRIEAILSERIMEREPELLKEARSLLPAIPFKDIDLLIVDEMGKEYSGTGMDMNVTGRCSQLGNSGPNPARLAVLNLTDNSHGNSAGMDEADVITKRFENKIDRLSVYVNSITVREINGLRMPAVMDNDRLAIKLCLFTRLPAKETKKLRAVWIHNTLNLEHMYVSEGLLAEVAQTEKMEIIGPAQDIVFDSEGNISEKPGAYIDLNSIKN